MGYKLGIMVKKIYLSLTLIITCSIYADDTSPKESLKQKVISSSYSYSVNQPAKIYSINASKNKISINSSRIGIPKSHSLRMFDGAVLALEIREENVAITAFS